MFDFFFLNIIIIFNNYYQVSILILFNGSNFLSLEIFGIDFNLLNICV